MFKFQKISLFFRRFGHPFRINYSWTNMGNKSK
jgi:hypothetical protein